ncbi:MAG: DUF721 domain-containing protein [Chloroflexi bacterium]|nr:DUF721 domain-containing protein [Chloroflexota bacterium]
MTRRPMRRVGDLLPDLARELGITTELQAADVGHAWAAAVGSLVPAAAGRSEVVEQRPPVLVVAAHDAATAQELRLHGGRLLAALAASPTEPRFSELRVVVRPR